jgi:hypothetical protein
MCRVRSRASGGSAFLVVPFESTGMNVTSAVELDGVPCRLALRVTPQPPHWTVIGGEAVEIVFKRRRRPMHFSHGYSNYGRRIPWRNSKVFSPSAASCFCDCAAGASASQRLEIAMEAWNTGATLGVQK